MSLLSILESFFPPEKSALPVHSKIDQINGMLREKKREDLTISDEDIIILESTIEILRAFEKAIKQFEAEYGPTIQFVVPQYHLLKDALMVSAEDTSLIVKLKTFLRRQLDAKYLPNISMPHKLGLLFWPQCKSLTKMTAAEREEVHKAARGMVASVAERFPAKSANADGGVVVPPEKRRRNSSSSDE